MWKTSRVRLLSRDSRVEVVEVPWTWERESRGPKPKSLEKVFGPASPKSEKGLEKGPKSQKKVSKNAQRVLRDILMPRGKN